MIHLFLVEDDEPLLQVTEKSFTKRGFTVTTACSIESATQIIEQWENNALPELAIFDLKLGNTQSLPLIITLLKRAPHCKILILTGYASIATAVQAVKLGAKDYLPKPASIDDMLAALEASNDIQDAVTSENNTEIVSTQRLEWEHIQRVLLKNDGNISAAARELNMHRRTLQRKLQKYPHKK